MAQEKTDWKDITGYESSLGKQSTYKGHSYEQIKKYLECLAEKMTEQFGYHPWMDHIEEIAKREAWKTQAQIEQLNKETKEGDKEMKKEEKAKLTELKKAAKVAAKEVQKEKAEKKETGFKRQPGHTRQRNPEAKANAYKLWKTGKTVEEIAAALPEVKPQTIPAWISGWKKGLNLPK